MEENARWVILDSDEMAGWAGVQDGPKEKQRWQGVCVMSNLRNISYPDVCYSGHCSPVYRNLDKDEGRTSVLLCLYTPASHICSNVGDFV